MRATVWTSLMTAAAAGVGTAGTDPESGWYRSIEKPPWQPPPVAFPLVWTPLYAAIAYGTGRLVEQALLPYAGWVGFATVLNASIWRRNR